MCPIETLPLLDAMQKNFDGQQYFYATLDFYPIVIGFAEMFIIGIILGIWFNHVSGSPWARDKHLKQLNWICFLDGMKNGTVYVLYILIVSGAVIATANNNSYFNAMNNKTNIFLEGVSPASSTHSVCET